MKKLVTLLAVLLLAQSSWAVGGASYSNQVMGARALGMGNTFAGIADDPTAVYYNPAGLTQLGNAAIAIGASAEPMNTENKTVAGESANMKAYIPVVPHLYSVLPFCDKRWAFGFGINSPFGLETHYSETGPLRYAATDSKVAYVNFNPELAYKINDEFSAAAGVVYGLAPNVTLKKMVNMSNLNFALSGNTVFDPTLTDGKENLSGDGDGWGYNLGLLFKPLENHSIGASYRSKITENVKGTVEITNINGSFSQGALGGAAYLSNVKTELIQPESFLFGYAFNPGKWTFAADAEWINWGSIKETKVDFSETNATILSILNNGNPIPRDWHNTWNFSGGANYKFNNFWEARGGYLHQNHVIPDSTWNPSIPDADKDAYCIGGSFNRPNFSIDLAYSYYIFKERSVPNTTNDTTIAGTYKLTSNVVTMSYTQRFSVNK